MCDKKYTRNKYDPCVQYSKLPGEKHIYLLLYVDDMLITSNSRSRINRLKKQLSSEFEMKDFGDAKQVLGMEIEKDWIMQGSLDLEGVFTKCTSEIQYQW